MKVLTYLINLDGSDERLKSASGILAAQDVHFERFSAVDGRGKSLDTFINYNDEKAKKVMGRSLLNGEIGCYLSHIGCVQNFLSTDADFLVVLEDDLELSEDYKKSLENILSFLHNDIQFDWNIINIGPKKKKICNVIKEFNGHQLLHAYYFPIRTIGLVWSRKGALEFIEKGLEIYMPIDNFLQVWLTGNSKGLSIWAPLVRPNGFESVIDVNRSTKKNKLPFRIKKQMRTWKNRVVAINNKLSKKNGSIL